MQRYTIWMYQYITTCVSRYSNILHNMIKCIFRAFSQIIRRNSSRVVKFTTTMYNYQLQLYVHRYITIFDISIRPKCVSIQYHCLMYHNMAIYQYIIISLILTIPWDLHLFLDELLRNFCSLIQDVQPVQIQVFK